MREEKTRRVVGVPESDLRRADSLPANRPGAQPRRPYLFLRKHDATHRQDAVARAVHQRLRKRHKQFARVRTRFNTSAAAELVTTNSSIWSEHNHEIRPSPARMIVALKQDGPHASVFTWDTR